MRLVDADMLCKYCDNNINHSITPNEIMRMPYIDAEPVKHGRWSEDDEGFYHCSACKELSDWDHRYCPNCGAKMDGGVDE